MKKRKSVRYYRSPDEKFLNELGSLNSSHFSPGDLFGSLAPAGCLILPLLFAAAVSGGIWMLPEDLQTVLRIVLVLSVGIKLLVLPELALDFPDDFFGICNSFHNWTGYLGILSMYLKADHSRIFGWPVWGYGIWAAIGVVICFLNLKFRKVRLTGKRVLAYLILCLFWIMAINALRP